MPPASARPLTRRPDAGALLNLILGLDSRERVYGEKRESFNNFKAEIHKVQLGISVV